MARVYKCDRCGEVYDRQPPDSKPRVSAGRKCGEKDLCPQCTDQLAKWLYELKNTKEAAKSNER